LLLLRGINGLKLFQGVDNDYILITPQLKLINDWAQSTKQPNNTAMSHLSLNKSLFLLNRTLWLPGINIARTSQLSTIIFYTPLQKLFSNLASTY